MTGWRMTGGEPSLDELLKDEIMQTVMRSAGLDATRLKAQLADAARRLDVPHRPAAGACITA